jgi:hypothetical protein
VGKTVKHIVVTREGVRAQQQQPKQAKLYHHDLPFYTYSFSLDEKKNKEK